MILYFASRRSPASEAPFDQFKATCLGILIVGGAGRGQILDHHIIDDEAAGVGAGSKAASASLAMYG